MVSFARDTGRMERRSVPRRVSRALAEPSCVFVRQPLLAQAIAVGFTALKMEELFLELTGALETLEPNDVRLLSSRLLRFDETGLNLFSSIPLQPNLDDVLDKLKETHATSAGLKVNLVDFISLLVSSF